MTHYAIQFRDGRYLVGFDRTTMRYLTSDGNGPFQIWQTRGAAEEGAKIIGGRVVPVVCSPCEHEAGPWLESSFPEIALEVEQEADRIARDVAETDERIRRGIRRERRFKL